MEFTLNEKETKKYNKWYKKHKKVCSKKGPAGAIGGKLTFSFTPTGLGPIIEVKCACGEKKDVTDWKNW